MVRRLYHGRADMGENSGTESAVRKSGRPIQKGDRTRARATGRKAARTKQAKLEALLTRARGATLAQLQTELGWKAHTVRAAVSRLRKAGHTIDLEEMKGRKAYRIAV